MCTYFYFFAAGVVGAPGDNSYNAWPHLYST